MLLYWCNIDYYLGPCLRIDRTANLELEKKSKKHPTSQCDICYASSSQLAYHESLPGVPECRCPMALGNCSTCFLQGQNWKQLQLEPALFLQPCPVPPHILLPEPQDALGRWDCSTPCVSGGTYRFQPGRPMARVHAPGELGYGKATICTGLLKELNAGTLRARKTIMTPHLLSPCSPGAQGEFYTGHKMH